MNYEREWADRRNAAGFAAECARLALSFYEGDHKSDLVAAIELAERCAGGGEIGTDNADVAYNVYQAAYYSSSAYSAYSAYRAALYKESSADAYAANAANYAEGSVDTYEIAAAFARWAVRDLSDGRELPMELRQAAGAAVVAGAEALAREILA